MTLHEKIKEQIKESMRAKDTMRLSVLRGFLAGFINELVAQKKKPSEILGDEEALAVIARAAKQRKDSIEQFTKGGRNDLADKEKAELIIIEEYLPKMMERDEVEKIVREKKEVLNITDKSKMGILMGAIMKELKGKADGAVVKEVVENLFI